ncbi:hypothetical protein ACFL96_18910 [Thermoproteota archaeon]
MKITKPVKSPNIEWERIEYTLKNGATVEIIRERILEDDFIEDDDILKEIV